MTNPSNVDSRTDTVVRLEGDLDIVVERTVAAPRDLVYRAYTDPEWMAQWWAPDGFTMDIKQMDVRPGGVWHYCMRSKEWGDAWGKGTYTEVIPTERVAWINAFSDEAGTSIPPESTMTATLTADGARTTVVMRASYAKPEDRTLVLKMGMEEGIKEGTEKLVRLLERVQA